MSGQHGCQQCQCHDAALATAHVAHMNIKITSMQNTNCQRPHEPKLKNTESRTQDRDIYRVSIQVKLSLIWEVTLLSHDIILLRIIWSMFDLIFVSLGYACMSELLLPSTFFTGISAGWYYTYNSCLSSQKKSPEEPGGGAFQNGFYVLLWIKCGHLEIPAYWFNLHFTQHGSFFGIGGANTDSDVCMPTQN